MFIVILFEIVWLAKEFEVGNFFLQNFEGIALLLVFSVVLTCSFVYGLVCSFLLLCERVGSFLSLQCCEISRWLCTRVERPVVLDLLAFLMWKQYLSILEDFLALLFFYLLLTFFFPSETDCAFLG